MLMNLLFSKALMQILKISLVLFGINRSFKHQNFGGYIKSMCSQGKFCLVACVEESIMQINFCFENSRGKKSAGSTGIWQRGS